MIEFAPHRRWGQRALIAVMVLVTGGVLGQVGASAYRLSEVSATLQAAQSQTTNVTNADRETLVLLEKVSELGETATPQQVVVQLGLMERQAAVSIASYPPGSAEVREIEGVLASLNGFPWDRLPATRGRDSALRLTCLALVSQSERRINALRSEQEKRFLSATTATLDANERSQLAMSVLVAVVLVLGISGVTIVILRSRSDLARSEGRYRSLVQRASDLTVVTDEKGEITYISPAAENLLGYRPDELLATSLLGYVEPGQRADVAAQIAVQAATPQLVHTIELRLCTQDGRVRTVESVCQNLLADADVRGLVWNGRDVTDRRALESKLSHQANHDPLTGLPNRTLLLRRLDEALRANPSAEQPISVIMVDLDGFKNVNDTLGHGAGDELLQAASKRLLGCVREADTAARLGGDEFAVLMEAGSPQQAVAAGRRIVDVLRRPFTVAGQEVRIGASLGLAHRSGTESAEDMLRDADIAMYVAKHTGKGRLEVFEADMRERASYRNNLHQDLARAVELGQIEVHYQPIIDLVTLRPRSLEALARWRRPDGALVPADDFIPAAEESGAIIEIGREVLRQACRAVQLWRDTVPGYGHLGMAVNVSVHQVLSGRLVDHVAEALLATDLPRRTLMLEITESVELEESEQVTAEFGRLRALGVRIAVDDFGAGYSSLGFLMSLDADALKIDRTLLDFDTTRRGSLVTAIAELGRTLGLTVIVEGVETVEHLARAREAPCDAAQGFHLARPLPFPDVPAFLAGWSEREVVPRPTGVPGS
jgi:diguanylate cyclase (GGDEF)-like protein/PAS domain S-box-containing protein